MTTPDRSLKRKDIVRVKRNCSFEYDAFRRRGQIGKVVTSPERVCVDFHKSHYETVCMVRFGPGDTSEITVDDLELLDDAVTALAGLGKFLPTEADIGRGVIYTPSHGGRAEDGVITGMNDEFVFVRYQGQHPGASGKATRYEDLRWLSEKPAGGGAVE